VLDSPEDARHRRQVADATVERTEQPPDRIDVLRHRIEIAHSQAPDGTLCQLQQRGRWQTTRPGAIAGAEPARQVVDEGRQRVSAKGGKADFD